MKKKYSTKFQIKDTVLRNELVRAHGMIILLVMMLMAVLGISSTLNVTLDPVLSFVAVILLAVVGLLSLSVVATILVKRR